MIASPSHQARQEKRRDLVLLVLLSLALFGFRLGSTPLPNPDEARYAEISREMLASGDWVTPRLNGVNYFEKPPLVYWTIAAAMAIFGPSEWTVRSVPMLFAIAGVLMTYAAGRRLYGRATGFAGAIVLMTSLLFFALARIVLLDMAVSVLMAAALFSFILAVREPAGPLRRRLFHVMYASMASATLTKGLIGFLVSGAVMFLWLLLCVEWRRLRPFHLATGTLIFLGLAAPWHVLAAMRNPTWLHRYFVYEHWQRFSSTAACRPGPWWYFFPIVLLGLFPWAGFLWPALQGAWPGGWSARREQGETWFLFTWVGFIFFFFSISHSKLPPYILPVFPALALLLGRPVAAAWQGSLAAFRPGARVFAGLCFLLAPAFVYVALTPGVIHFPDQAEALRPDAFALAIVTAVGGGLTLLLGKKGGPRPALAALAITTLVFYFVLVHALPNLQRPGTSELALIVKARVRPGDRVMNYHEFFHDFAYYSGNVVDLVSESGNSAQGELELAEDPKATRSGRFIDDAAFRAAWEKATRIWVVAEKPAARKILADPKFQCHVIGESKRHILFSNRP